MVVSCVLRVREMDAIGPLRWRKLVPFAPAVTSVGVEETRDPESCPGRRELSVFVAQNIGSYWHPVGTCAMGLDTKAVVDPSLRVRGTTHLRVADASIMPTITSGNIRSQHRKGATHA